MPDLNELQKQRDLSEEEVVVVIYQPNGEPYLARDGTSSTMTIVGPESQRVKAAKRQITRRILSTGHRRRRLGAEEADENRVIQASAAVIDWHGWESGAEDLPCTPENVRRVLAYDHILEQVEAAVLGHADFFENSSTS